MNLKEKWLEFLLFGFLTLIISVFVSAIISTYVSNKISEKMAGPPCRVELAIDRFEAPPKKLFLLNFRITNYKDENLFLEQIDSYCFWQERKEKESKPSNISEELNLPRIKLPTTEDLTEPPERPYIPSYGSKPWSSRCFSPEESGEYNIKVFVRTNKGSCESNIVMMVK